MLSESEIQSIIGDYEKPSKTVLRSLYVDKIVDYLSRKEVLILKGIRRCGKSTIMRQVLSKIENGVYINLDDYRFFEHKSIALLEKILQLFLGDKKLYLFLDEVQTIPHFESWLRTHYDKESNVKFIVSGSNSTLMSKDLASLMTGRTITFEITPLNFKEFQDFSKGNLQEYLEFGGFPEVVLETNLEKKREILSNYFNTIVEKDIILKSGVQQNKQLKELLKYLLGNPGVRISANKLSKQLGLSINTVKSYLSLAEEVYLLFEVPFFSYSAKTKFIGGRVSKYYCIDNGFTKIFTTRFEKSKAYENSVALHFFKERENLYYWVDKSEVDFVINDRAINVVASKNVPKREFEGLEEIKKEFKLIKNCMVISEEKSEETSSLFDFLLS
jgi:predicted AAA+ superfamily ATPase